MFAIYIKEAKSKKWMPLLDIKTGKVKQFSFKYQADQLVSTRKSIDKRRSRKTQYKTEKINPGE